MEMKTSISCTILRHTKILIAVGVSIISLATVGSKNHTTNITKIITQSIEIIIKRLESVVSQRESVKNDKPTISMSLSHCIHQTLNSNATGRSEERFSRNAETDLVCRLLLEKKNGPGEVFGHRNIANLVTTIDLNVQSGINYAILQFKLYILPLCHPSDRCGSRSAILPSALGFLNS